MSLPSVLKPYRDLVLGLAVVAVISGVVLLQASGGFILAAQSPVTPPEPTPASSSPTPSAATTPSPIPDPTLQVLRPTSLQPQAQFLQARAPARAQVRYSRVKLEPES